jgi:hypothetical protein
MLHLWKWKIFVWPSELLTLMFSFQTVFKHIKLDVDRKQIFFSNLVPQKKKTMQGWVKTWNRVKLEPDMPVSGQGSHPESVPCLISIGVHLQMDGSKEELLKRTN